MTVIDKVIAWLQAEIDKLKRLKIRQGAEDSASEVDIVQSLYIKLRADYDNLVNNYTNLQDNHMMVTKQLSRLRVGIENFKELNTGLRKASETKRMTIDRLQGELESVRAENRSLQRLLTDKEASIAALQLQCDRLKAGHQETVVVDADEGVATKTKGKFDPLWYDEYHQRNKDRTPKDKDYLSLRAFAREKAVDSHTIRRGFKKVELDRHIDI
ncbi:MAG: hypothetical protein HQL03_15100 [Nitrospirae bacterium]|nr:hypothetical protein [Nitrospirota bacterium]